MDYPLFLPVVAKKRPAKNNAKRNLPALKLVVFLSIIDADQSAALKFRKIEICDELLEKTVQMIHIHELRNY